MGLLSFLKGKSTPGATPTRAAAAADAVGEARSRARRRLIGAAVLVGLGVIGFPLLFETQPRPIAVDVPIEIPRKDAAAPLSPPRAAAPARPAASTPAPGAPAAAATAPKKDEVITESRADAGREVALREPSPAVVAAPASAPVASKPAASAPAAKPASNTPAANVAKAPTEAPKPAATDAARAKALLEGKDTTLAKADSPAAKGTDAAAATTRMVVQVGAFADANAAKDMRQRVEKLGLKTYTQVVETDSGKRIRVRVGPFPSREEADKVAERIKAAGIQASVLTL